VPPTAATIVPASPPHANIGGRSPYRRGPRRKRSIERRAGSIYRPDLPIRGSEPVTGALRMLII
jgi:hypothetical protein